MKINDLVRNGGDYMNRLKTFFDKALNRNGKVNQFLTDIGIVSVDGFEITLVQDKKIKKVEFDFIDMKGDSDLEKEAKGMFISLANVGLRGKNNIEFTCNIYDPENKSTGIMNRDIYLEISDFVKTHEFGGQQRGGVKVNMGNKYEGDLAEDFISYVNGKTPKNYPEHVSEIISTLQNKLKLPIVGALHDGGKNSPRPLKLDGDSIIISSGGQTTLDIGATLTDITLFFGPRKVPVYLSVKFGSTLSFFNCGISGRGKTNISLFPEAELKQMNIPDDGKKYLDMFGIDYLDFLTVFHKYTGDKTSAATVPNHSRTTHLNATGKAALEKLCASGIGYGYWMVHYDGTNLEFYEIDRDYMNKASTVTGNAVQIDYGGASGKGKRIDMSFETQKYEFKFNIRSKSGGVFPTHTNGDYYKK
jgi:hypothetical protein